MANIYGKHNCYGSVHPEPKNCLVCFASFFKFNLKVPLLFKVGQHQVEGAIYHCEKKNVVQLGNVDKHIGEHNKSLKKFEVSQVWLQSKWHTVAQRQIYEYACHSQVRRQKDVAQVVPVSSVAQE